MAMETVPYKRDEEGIERRKNIAQFGNTDGKDLEHFISFADQPPKFNTFDLQEIDDEEDEKKEAYVFRRQTFDDDIKPKAASSTAYVPPNLRSVRTTIKVINIPLEIRDNVEFAKKLERSLGLFPKHVFIVLDPDSKASRGYAYITFDSLEAAKNAINKIDGYAIDSNLLGAELAKKRPDQ